MVINGDETGRSYYTDAGRSIRRGLELSVQQQLKDGITDYLAYTYLQAKYDHFVDDQSNDQAGNSLPGIPRHSFFAELAWQLPSSGFSTTLEAQGRSKRYATDSNAHNTPGYTTLNWRAAYTRYIGNISIEPFARLNNLADRNYVCSLIINEGNQRFYEPAPSRNRLIGMSVQYHWK